MSEEPEPEPEIIYYYNDFKSTQIRGEFRNVDWDGVEANAEFDRNVTVKGDLNLEANVNFQIGNNTYQITPTTLSYLNPSSSVQSQFDGLATNINLKASLSQISAMNNTSDINKPVSTAQQNALNLKQNILTNAQFLDATSSIQNQTNALANKTTDLTYNTLTSAFANHLTLAQNKTLFFTPSVGQKVVLHQNSSSLFSNYMIGVEQLTVRYNIDYLGRHVFSTANINSTSFSDLFVIQASGSTLNTNLTLNGSLNGISQTILSYLGGASSNIQTQINGKQATLSNAGFLDATSSVQTQLNGKQATLSNAVFLDATSSVQSQLNSKTGISSNNAFTGTNSFNTSLPTSTLTPTLSTQLITKAYADSVYATGSSSSNYATKIYVDSTFEPIANNNLKAWLSGPNIFTADTNTFVNIATTGNITLATGKNISFNASVGRKIMLHPSTSFYDAYAIDIDAAQIRYNVDYTASHVFTASNSARTAFVELLRITNSGVTFAGTLNGKSALQFSYLDASSSIQAQINNVNALADTKTTLAAVLANNNTFAQTLTLNNGLNITSGPVLLLTNNAFPASNGGTQQMGMQLYYNVDYGLGSSSYVNGSGSGSGGFFFYTHGYYVARQLLFYATRTVFNIQGLNFQTSGTINGVSPTALSFLNNVSSDLQTQLNTKTTLAAIQANNNSFTGTNIFNQVPDCVVSPATATHLVNKAYVDTNFIPVSNNNLLVWLSAANTFTNINTFNDNVVFSGNLNNISPTVFSYISGLTSSAQTQITALQTKTTDLTFAASTSTFANNVNINGILNLTDFSVPTYGTFPTTNTGTSRGLGLYWNRSLGNGEVSYLCRGQGGVGGHQFFISRSTVAPVLVLDLTTVAMTSYVPIVFNTTINNISATTFAFLNGVTSSIQTQINGKASLNGTNTWTGVNTFSATTNLNENVSIAAGKQLTFSNSYPDRKIILYNNNPLNNYHFFGINVDNYTGSTGTNLRINVTAADDSQTFSYSNAGGTAFVDTLRVNGSALTSLVPVVAPLLTVSGTSNLANISSTNLATYNNSLTSITQTSNTLGLLATINVGAHYTQRITIKSPLSIYMSANSNYGTFFITNISSITCQVLKNGVAFSSVPVTIDFSLLQQVFSVTANDAYCQFFLGNLSMFFTPSDDDNAATYTIQLTYNKTVTNCLLNYIYCNTTVSANTYYACNRQGGASATNYTSTNYSQDLVTTKNFTSGAVEIHDLISSGVVIAPTVNATTVNVTTINTSNLTLTNLTTTNLTSNTNATLNTLTVNGNANMKQIRYYGQVGAYLIDGTTLYSIGSPVYNSIPDFGNFYSRQGSAATGVSITTGSVYTTPLLMNDRDDIWMIMPGFRLVVYSEYNYSSGIVLDMTNNGTVPIHAVPTSLNTASSCRIFFQGTEIA